ncbi:hypothetical protein HDU98_003900 [Podochytrium sp. JEL0797]|nr:hypothetical protein HDU98_003900 [Podochytrium sp. JEL0797]
MARCLVLLVLLTANVFCGMTFAPSSFRPASVDASLPCASVLQIEASSSLAAFGRALAKLRKVYANDAESLGTLEVKHKECVAAKWAHLLAAKGCKGDTSLHCEWAHLTMSPFKELTKDVKRFAKRLAESINPVHETTVVFFESYVYVFIAVISRVLAMLYCEDSDSETDRKKAKHRRASQGLAKRGSVAGVMSSFTFVRIVAFAFVPFRVISIKHILDTVDADLLGAQGFIAIVLQILAIVETLVLAAPIQEYLDYYSRLQSISSRLSLAYSVLLVPIPFVSLFFDSVADTFPETNLSLLDFSGWMDAFVVHTDVFVWAAKWGAFYLGLRVLPDVLRLYESAVIRNEFLVRGDEAAAVRKTRHEAKRNLVKQKQEEEKEETRPDRVENRRDRKLDGGNEPDHEKRE